MPCSTGPRQAQCWDKQQQWTAKPSTLMSSLPVPRMNPASVLPTPVANWPNAPALQVWLSVPKSTSPGLQWPSCRTQQSSKQQLLKCRDDTQWMVAYRWGCLWKRAPHQACSGLPAGHAPTQHQQLIQGQHRRSDGLAPAWSAAGQPLLLVAAAAPLTWWPAK